MPHKAYFTIVISARDTVVASLREGVTAWYRTCHPHIINAAAQELLLITAN
jgi:sensor histidine kinase regulating citrate/malate metabolism